MTVPALVLRGGWASLGCMQQLKYDHEVWRKIAAARDAALANPEAPRPEWMIGQPWTLSAFMAGYGYVVYHRNVPLRPLSYGGEGDIAVSLHSCVGVMLDRTRFANAGRSPFVTGQGTIRAVSFSDVIDEILKWRSWQSQHRSPPSAQAS